MTLSARLPTDTTTTNRRTRPSSEYAMVRRTSSCNVPHLTVASGDKYALSKHDSTLRLIKQQRTMSERRKVSYIYYMCDTVC